jgi:hypothetical protein
MAKVSDCASPAEHVIASSLTLQATCLAAPLLWYGGAIAFMLAGYHNVAAIVVIVRIGHIPVNSYGGGPFCRDSGFHSCLTTPGTLVGPWLALWPFSLPSMMPDKMLIAGSPLGAR